MLFPFTFIAFTSFTFYLLFPVRQSVIHDVLVCFSYNRENFKIEDSKPTWVLLEAVDYHKGNGQEKGV